MALLSVAVLALSACTNKKDQARIKALEAEIETIQEENNTAFNEREKDLVQRDEAARSAQVEAMKLTQQLTQERDAAVLELAQLKKMTARAEATRLAAVPKDATTPGHVDYNPGNEPKITQALASITGDVSKGTGFVVACDGKRYIYTDAHTLNGNSRLAIANSAGLKFTKFGNLEVAEGAPFVRLELLDAAEAPALELAAESPALTGATPITALGTSTASGTVTADRGTVFAQNDEVINIDPSLMLGKTGGPVIINATGKVVALIVSTGAERTGLWAAPATSDTFPNRACRLNRKLQWKAIAVGAFLGESKKIADYDNITRVAQALAKLNPTPSGLGMEIIVANDQTALAILTAMAKDLPIATDVIAMDSQLAGKKGRTSDADIKKRFSSLVSSAMSQMQRSSVGFEPAKFSSYHRRFAENSIKWRKDAIERLQSLGGKSEE
jgi:hypothetical protein